MILCHECHKPIEAAVEYRLRTPLRGKRLCDDCGLLFDHASDMDLSAEAPVSE